MKQTFQNAIPELLRARGLKATPERQSILLVLLKAKHPLTIQEIKSVMKNSPIDQATIYRTMNRLVTMGIVRQVDFQHGHMHYELYDTEDHHHLICTSCGRIEDIHGCSANKLAVAVLRSSSQFAKVTSHSFELFGLCKRCDRKGGV